MQPIPDDILVHFDAIMEKKSVPSTLRDDYRTWLRYYLDFRVKYPPPAEKSEHVRLFIEKMRSKGKSGKSLHHAAHALSLFFSLQMKNKQITVRDDRGSAELSSPVEAANPGGAQPSGRPAANGEPAEKKSSAFLRMTAQRPGRKYNEWWSLERTPSAE